MATLNINDIKKSCEGTGPLSMGQGHAGDIPLHLNAYEHVTGKTRYVASIPKIEGQLYGEIFFSPVARGVIESLDISQALASPGVEGIYTSKDVPGTNIIGSIFRDEPLLAEERVNFVGQPVALLLANSKKEARKAKKLIKIKVKEEAPVLDPMVSFAKKDFVGPERTISRGNPAEAFKSAEHIIEGTMENGGQEHMYLETQASLAVPNEDDSVNVYSGSQNPSEVQEHVAHVLGISQKDVVVEIKRMGGAFGGKEAQGTTWACLAALGAALSHKPVQVSLERHDDGMVTGKRHPCKSEYKVGFDSNGVLSAVEIDFFFNSGATADLSTAISGRALSHSDNCYFIPHFRSSGYPCRTNLPTNTAFRGFGAPQGVLVIEAIIEKIASYLKLDPLEVRRRNLYKKGQTTPYGQIIEDNVLHEVFDRLDEKLKWNDLKKEIKEFNRSSRFIKKGLAVVPVKFGISFNAPHLNQGMSLVLVYADGTVSCTHGGTEMGQEVNTKVAQIVATELGIDINKVRIEATNTTRIANVAPTAASTGSDINGHAAKNAADQIKNRLAELAATILNDANLGINPCAEYLVFKDNMVYDSRCPELSIAWSDLVHKAYMARIDLGAHGFYATPGLGWNAETGKGRPFLYYANGVGAAQITLDTITGEHYLDKMTIIHDVGESLNPAIDLGQVLGAFVQGLGWCTGEEVKWNEKGRILSASPATYKVPGIMDITDDLDIEFIENRKNKKGIKRSKAIGEPPLIYGEAVFFAILDALKSIAPKGQEVELTMPATYEKVLMEITRLEKLS